MIIVKGKRKGKREKRKKRKTGSENFQLINFPTFAFLLIIIMIIIETFNPFGKKAGTFRVRCVKKLKTRVKKN